MQILDFELIFLHGSKKVFLGKYSITMNKKDRFLPPARFKKDLSIGFYIAQGFDQNLWVLTPAVFGSIYQKFSSLNIADPLARMLLRMILSTAHESRINKDGTIAIPKGLKEFVKIEKTLQIIGQGDYFEIWEPAIWAKQEAQIIDAKSNSNRFSSLSIATR